MSTFQVSSPTGVAAQIQTAPEQTFQVTSPQPIVVQIDTSKGEKGEPGEDSFYEQAFTNQSTVVVAHNLGKKPATTIVDSAGDEVEGEVSHDSDNQLTLTFSASFTGVVYCN